jgi:hypothetical protein
MCDYSLELVRSRPAKVGDKLMTRDFGTGTRGFAALANGSLFKIEHANESTCSKLNTIAR